jgi:hypothetical protein
MKTTNWVIYHNNTKIETRMTLLFSRDDVLVWFLKTNVHGLHYIYGSEHLGDFSQYLYIQTKTFFCLIFQGTVCYFHFLKPNLSIVFNSGHALHAPAY